MERQQLIARTLEKISLLPDRRLREVADYIDFLIRRSEDRELVQGIKDLTTQTKSFHFLEEEEELYNDSDLIQKYE